MLVPLHVVKHEDLARAGREPLDRVLEIHAQVAARRRRRQEVDCRLVVCHSRALDRKRAPPLDDDVDREPVEPGPERRVAAKLAELLPRTDEDVLRDLVGLRWAQHPPRKAVNARDVSAIDPLEGRRISAGRKGDVRIDTGGYPRIAAQRHRGASHGPVYKDLDGFSLPEG